MAKAARDIEFLYEMGTIRHIQRTWRQFLNADYANLAEHHFRVAWTALVLAKQEGVTDTEKVLKMALLHDIAESRTGDVNYLQRQYVKRDEEQAIHDMLADTSLAEEFLALLAEYERRESIEAKIVKDADNLDVDFEIHEQKHRGLRVPAEWMEIRNHVGHEKLYTESAKQMLAELYQTDPNSWHVKGRNRYNGGDWKKE
jgi:putative hydrolase of HD superfamily